MNTFQRACVLVVMAGRLFGCAGAPEPGMKTESFDRDPGWDEHNNRSARQQAPVRVRQDFGFSKTSRAGGKVSEAGGWISQAAEGASYAMAIDPKSFDDRLEASGTFTVLPGGTPDDTAAHLLLGFFNADSVNEWRTPSTIAIRISARGDTFAAYVEYCTSKWRAGADSKSFPNKTDPFATGDKPHKWSLKYDPRGNDGAGVITATIDDKTAVCNLDAAHKADGATFNRFGILNVMKAAGEGAASEFYLDDLTVNGTSQSFDVDPKWEGVNNRRTYETRNVRPRFDFGYSPTHFAGGKAKGEIGGQTFRGDCRYPERMAFYGDGIGPLTLERPFKASGKIAFTRGVTDSTALFGFFNSRASMEVSNRQDSAGPKSFLGIAIEGPSAEGFYFYPCYRVDGDGEGSGGRTRSPLYIHPDGTSHEWTLEYDPSGKGALTITLDGKRLSIPLGEGHKQIGATFDRFGIVTTWIDGNGQHIYLDDLTYTASQEEK